MPPLCRVDDFLRKRRNNALARLATLLRKAVKNDATVAERAQCRAQCRAMIKASATSRLKCIKMLRRLIDAPALQTLLPLETSDPPASSIGDPSWEWPISERLENEERASMEDADLLDHLEREFGGLRTRTQATLELFRDCCKVHEDAVEAAATLYTSTVAAAPDVASGSHAAPPDTASGSVATSQGAASSTAPMTVQEKQVLGHLSGTRKRARAAAAAAEAEESHGQDDPGGSSGTRKRARAVTFDTAAADAAAVDTAAADKVEEDEGQRAVVADAAQEEGDEGEGEDEEQEGDGGNENTESAEAMEEPDEEQQKEEQKHLQIKKWILDHPAIKGFAFARKLRERPAKATSPAKAASAAKAKSHAKARSPSRGESAAKGKPAAKGNTPAADNTPAAGHAPPELEMLQSALLAVQEHLAAAADHVADDDDSAEAFAQAVEELLDALRPCADADEHLFGYGTIATSETHLSQAPARDAEWWAAAVGAVRLSLEYYARSKDWSNWCDLGKELLPPSRTGPPALASLSRELEVSRRRIKLGGSPAKPRGSTPSPAQLKDALAAAAPQWESWIRAAFPPDLEDPPPPDLEEPPAKLASPVKPATRAGLAHGQGRGRAQEMGSAERACRVSPRRANSSVSASPVPSNPPSRARLHGQRRGREPEQASAQVTSTTGGATSVRASSRHASASPAASSSNPSSRKRRASPAPAENATKRSTRRRQ